MQHALIQENNYLLNKVNQIRDDLDKMTDLCENEDFLNKNILEELIKYLDVYHDLIITNIDKFYRKNMSKYDRKEEDFG